MAKATYRIQKVDGRHYFHDGKKYVLIDTGYGRTGSIDGTIGEFKVGIEDKNKLHHFNPTPMPDGSLAGAMLCPQTGYSCLLKDGFVTIDDDAKELPKHDWFLPYDSRYMYHGRPFKPVVTCKVDGVEKTMFFDTGMRIPVIDDESIVLNKSKVGEVRERIGWLYMSVVAPVYEATFEFSCGLKFNGRFEYDYSHSLMNDIFGDDDNKGFFGVEELFGKYDIFISAVEGRHGIAVIERK